MYYKMDSYDQEIERLQKEIDNLKSDIEKYISHINTHSYNYLIMRACISMIQDRITNITHREEMIKSNKHMKLIRDINIKIDLL